MILMMVQAGFVSMVIVCIAVIFTVVLMSGCTGTVTPAPVTPTPNTTAIVLDYSKNPPQYATTYPIVVNSHKGNFSLYGKLTINGNVPTGKTRQLPGGEVLKRSLGELKIFSVSESYKLSSGAGGITYAELIGSVGPDGSYYITGLNPGEMWFVNFKLYNVSVGGDSYIFIEQFKKGSSTYGQVKLNLTKDISRCDIDLTDMIYVGHAVDDTYIYYCVGVPNNTDL